MFGLSAQDWQAIGLSLKLAVITALILVVLCTVLAYQVLRLPVAYQRWINGLLSLPISLPPTVLGFYLLLLLSPDTGLGQWGALFLFRFEGLVLASVVYGLPFVYPPIAAALQQIKPLWWHCSLTLGRSPWYTGYALVLPLILPAVVMAGLLGFAHTLGEFGLVLMLGGSLPGETLVASIALFQHVESLNYAQAHRLAGALLVIAVAVVALMQPVQRRLLVLTA